MAERPNRQKRVEIAQKTLDTIAAGLYTKDSRTYNLADVVKYSEKNTLLYGHNSPSLKHWGTRPSPTTIDEEASALKPTQMDIVECTTVQAIQMLAAGSSSLLIGVLNFASATKPGGGFLTGAEAQEESLARTSTIYRSLITPTASQFYKSHTEDKKNGFYSHAMIYTPDVILFRDDMGEFLGPPIQISVVTSPAVNAGVVREREKGGNVEMKIEVAMRDRMGRILRVYEERGDRILVLGSFGTGVFRNDIKMVATIWADLLARPGARFSGVFERVVFAIYGRDTYVLFKDSFEARVKEALPRE